MISTTQRMTTSMVTMLLPNDDGNDDYNDDGGRVRRRELAVLEAAPGQLEVSWNIVRFIIECNDNHCSH